MCIFTNVGDDECFGEGGKTEKCFSIHKKAKITKRSKGEEKKREKRQKREHTVLLFSTDRVISHL